MNITIGTPHLTETYYSRFGDDLINLIAYSLGQGIAINRIATFRDNITFARNKIASQFIQSDSDYLLFLDDDMVFSKELLVNMLSRDKEIVGALTFLRSEPHEPSMYTLNNDGMHYDSVFMWNPKALVEVDALGMAATLIHRSVFEKMKSISQEHKQIYGFFDNLYFMGEDFRFCRKARDLEYKIYCDTSQLVGHITQQVIGFPDYKTMTDYKLHVIKKEMARKSYENNKS